MMPNFARTSTKVFTWRRADAPEIPLNHHEFTKEDVLDGRVFPFYNDMDPDENKCSVSLEEPKERIGTIFVGDQTDVDHLRWYDEESLSQMLPHQKLDPDTLKPWGDFSRHLDSSMLLRFRKVLPISFLNRWITNGTAHENLEMIANDCRQKRELNTQMNGRSLLAYNRDDLTLRESSSIQREFLRVIHSVNNNPNLIIQSLNEVLNFSLIHMIRIHKEWRRSYRNIHTGIGLVTPTDLDVGMNTAIVAVQAFVRVMYPNTPLLQIVNRCENGRFVFLDAPLFNDGTRFGDERANFHCALYPSVPIRPGEQLPILPVDAPPPPQYVIYVFFMNGAFQRPS